MLVKLQWSSYASHVLTIQFCLLCMYVLISHSYILNCIELLENNVIKHYYHLTTYSNAGQFTMVPCMHAKQASLGCNISNLMEERLISFYLELLIYLETVLFHGIPCSHTRFTFLLAKASNEFPHILCSACMFDKIFPHVKFRLQNCKLTPFTDYHLIHMHAHKAFTTL